MAHSFFALTSGHFPLSLGGGGLWGKGVELAD